MKFLFKKKLFWQFFLLLSFSLVGLFSHTMSLNTLGYPVFYSLCPATSHWFLYGGEDGFVVTDLSQQKTRKIIERNLMISAYSQALCVNGQWISPRSLIIEPIGGVLEVNGREYEGSFMINPRQKGFSIVICGAVHRSYANTAFCMYEYLNNEQKSCQLDQLDTLNQTVRSTVDVVSQASKVSQINCANQSDQVSLERLNQNAQENNAQTNIESLPKNGPFHVRVLLDELESRGSWDLVSDHGFMVWNAQDSYKKSERYDKNLPITVRDGILYLNGKKMVTDQIYLTPVGQSISFKDKTYCGAFIIVHQKGRTMIINCVELEEYVSAVLDCESWPGWPLEVNKAFAIACRTYVIAMVMRAKKNNRLYHIKNTNKHQKYGGMHTNSLLRQAVADTRGIFVAYNKAPILAMFDSCCGGVIPAHISGFDFMKAPYLARTYPCSYCKDCQLYAWQAEYGLQEFERCLGQKITLNGAVNQVQIAKKDKAGLVKEVVFKNPKKTVTVTGKKLYSLLKEVKSFCFNIAKKKNKIVVEGRGYGHHLGLCQWGARQMVRDGWDYQDILQFYYPGTQFMRVS